MQEQDRKTTQNGPAHEAAESAAADRDAVKAPDTGAGKTPDTAAGKTPAADAAPHSFTTEKVTLQLSLRSLILAAFAIIIFYFLIARFRGLHSALSAFETIIRPLTLGLVMAFIMNPIVGFLERLFLHPKRVEMLDADSRDSLQRTVRTISTIIAAAILIGLVAAFIALVVPQFVEAIQNLSEHVNEKIIGVIDWADNLTRQRFHPSMERAKSDERIELALSTAIGWVREYFNISDDGISIKSIASLGSNVVRVLVNVIVGIFISIYVLLRKEDYTGHLKRLTYVILKPVHANTFMEIVRKGNDIFYGFIIGKLIDSAIIGVICYVSMLILNLPYALLCSFIIGVTNIIPIFGPYIGALPTVILLFVNNPPQGIIFLIYIIILQQVDGNLIGPKILGDSTGISSFWVLVAIVIGGRLFGFGGMLVGVPVLSLILYILDRLMGHLAAKKGLPSDWEDFTNVDHVDPETGEVVRIPEDRPRRQILFRKKKKRPKK